jgi:hypothetical protein
VAAAQFSFLIGLIVLVKVVVVVILVEWEVLT